MDKKIKIIVTGEVRGRFKQLFNRIESINKKAGPFELLLCVGEFFGTGEQIDELNAYKNGLKQIPVPTYILGPCSESTVKYYKDLTDGEICSNLTFLGKRGLYTLSSGVKIAYLSGTENVASNEEYHFNKDDIVAVRNSCLVKKPFVNDYKGVDILLTTQIPYGVLVDKKDTSKLISFLSKEIRPRYHFCPTNGNYFEAQPHRTPADEITQLQLATRFVAISNLANISKQKYIYAMNLSATDKMRLIDLLEKTTDEILTPYIDVVFNDLKVEKKTLENKQYFYDMHNNGRNYQKRQNYHNDGERKFNDKRRKIMNIDQDKCWFCLSSPDVEKHLVITIGDNFYLALAKGPLNRYHVLIMSINHIPAASMISEDDWNELLKFKNALKEFFHSEGYVVCFTERHYKSSHLQINALGIDKGYAWKIQHAFEDKAEEFNLEFEKLAELKSLNMLPHMGPYFVAELPDGVTLITTQMKQFPIHFARDVFCSENLLNCDEKVNWKECLLDKAEEIQMVQNFRKKFAKYDFTL